MTHLDYLHLKLAELHAKTAAQIATLTPPLAACERTSAATKKAIVRRDADALFLPLFERGALVTANANRAVAEQRTIVVEAQEIDSFYINLAAALPSDQTVIVSQLESGEGGLLRGEAEEFFARSGIAPYLGSAGTIDNALLIRLPGIRARALVNALGLDGVAITNGEACTAGLGVPSTIVQSYGFDEDHSREAISLSWSGQDDPDAIFAAFEKLLFRYSQIKQLA